MPIHTVHRARRTLADPRFKFFVALAVAAAAAPLALLPLGSNVPDRTASIRRLPAALYAPSSRPVALDQLGPGETLSGIWERNGRPRAEMVAVVEAASAVFDVRQLRAGTPIELYLENDGGSVAGPEADWPPEEGSRLASRPSSWDRVGSRRSPGIDETRPGPTGTPAGDPMGAPAPTVAALDSVLIRVDADRTVAVLRSGPDYHAQLRETPLREAYRTHVGCIETSLYGALESAAGDYSLLALELDRIFGGVLDFYTDLHPGDCVSLHFQVLERPDGSFRLGRIESAELVGRGNRHVAIWFEAPDGTTDYYDRDGLSLRRQFLRSPLKFTRISSGFTLRRFHPILKRYRAHPGIDYAAPSGTPVQAAGNGVVTFAGWKRGFGKTVELKHGKVYATSYAHLSRIGAGVRRGARVSQGEVIGYVGSTGLSTAPHLDYRFAKNGRYVNPLDESLPTGEPVDPRYAALFEERRERAMRDLGEAYRTILVMNEERSASPLAGGGADPLQSAGLGDD